MMQSYGRSSMHCQPFHLTGAVVLHLCYGLCLIKCILHTLFCAMLISRDRRRPVCQPACKPSVQPAPATNLCNAALNLAPVHQVIVALLLMLAFASLQSQRTQFPAE